ncbi:MAG: hypothetical protein MUO62_08520 [Anaerolineales bacterium]|nr:hypothetical protein [Anaerolineales bacterium]
MTKSENKNIVERHGCIVCARIFNILAVYTPDDELVDCVVTSFGGHRVLDEGHPLVACDTHTAEEIEAAYQRWQSRNDKESDNEQEDE